MQPSQARDTAQLEACNTPIEVIEAKPCARAAEADNSHSASVTLCTADLDAAAVAAAMGTSAAAACARVATDTLGLAAAFNPQPGDCHGAPMISASRQRLDVDPAEVRKGLGQLVLTLVKLLHETMERQAIRRMDSGSLTDEQIERLGHTLMLQSQEISRLAKDFGVSESELNLDLGPLGKLM